MPSVILFASVREAAGERSTFSSGATVQEILDDLSNRYGERFSRLIPYCSFYVGEDKVAREHDLREIDELAILPPVSGG